jgi:hypothetical protein
MESLGEAGQSDVKIAGTVETKPAKRESFWRGGNRAPARFSRETNLLEPLWL